MKHEHIGIPEKHMDYPTLWVSFCGKFRIIRCLNDIQYIVQSYAVSGWRSFSFHVEWGSIQRKFYDMETFADLPDEPPAIHRSFGYYDEGAFKIEGHSSLVQLDELP